MRTAHLRSTSNRAQPPRSHKSKMSQMLTLPALARVVRRVFGRLLGQGNGAHLRHSAARRPALICFQFLRFYVFEPPRRFRAPATLALQAALLRPLATARRPASSCSCLSNPQLRQSQHLTLMRSLQGQGGERDQCVQNSTAKMESMWNWPELN